MGLDKLIPLIQWFQRWWRRRESNRSTPFRSRKLHIQEWYEVLEVPKCRINRTRIVHGERNYLTISQAMMGRFPLKKANLLKPRLTGHDLSAKRSTFPDWTFGDREAPRLGE
jgi:hypothetical protein